MDPASSRSSPPRLLLTYTDAAQLLAVSPRYLRGLVYSGQLPSVLIGRRLRRIAAEDVYAFVDALRDRATPTGDRRIGSAGVPLRRSHTPLVHARAKVGRHPGV